jgi:hypothetical protein
MKRYERKKAVKASCMAMAVLVMCLLVGSVATAESALGQVWPAGSDQALAQVCGCQTIALDVTAHATTPDPMGQYAGTALMTLGGQKKIYQADVVINPQGSPSFASDGTIKMELRNQFSVPELTSTFECYDHVTFSPVVGDPTRYAITNQVVIFNGTGVFGPAYGKLFAYGELSMTEGSIWVKAAGRVCDLEDIK